MQCGGKDIASTSLIHIDVRLLTESVRQVFGKDRRHVLDHHDRNRKVGW